MVSETPVVKSLHPYIDLSTIVILNAKKPTNVEHVFRASLAEQRDAPLQSDIDAQLIIKIPY